MYYEDIEQTRVVSEEAWEQVLDGELRVFGERREHLSHCVYLLLSISQIVRDGTPFTEKLTNYEHSEHCANVLLEQLRKSPDWSELQTFAGTASFDQYCDDSRVVPRSGSDIC